MGDTRGPTKLALAAFCLATAMTLAACGGGGSADSSSVSGAAAGSAAYTPSPSSASGSSSSSSSSASGSGPAAQPGGVTLDWTAPNQNTDGTPVAAGEIAGYKIIYGESASALDQFVAINDPSITTYTFQNLPSTTWYFAIVAVDSSGNESTPTNVISATT